MPGVAEAFITLRPDVSGLGAEIKKGLGPLLDVAARDARMGIGDSITKGVGQGVDGAEAHTKRLGGAFADIGKVAAGVFAGGAIAAGVSQITGLFSGSVTAAKDLGESVNAVQKIFGDSAGQILDWGKGNATAFGLSQRAFNELATPLGAMLKNTGLDMGTVSGKTIDLTKRAADLASVFNSSVEDALGAVQAGLRGEADPLERYGIGLSAAAVEAKALGDTGKKTAKDLTTQELALARINLIMDQSATSAGDFADTSKDLANAQRIAAAKTEELQAKLGTKLIPVTLAITALKLKLAGVLVDKLLPAMDRLGAAFGFVGRHMDVIGPIVAGLGATIGAALIPAMVGWTIATWAQVTALAAQAVAMIAANAPLILIAAGIGLLVAGVVLLVKHWDTIVEKVPLLGVALEAVKGAAAAVAGFFTDTVVPAIGSVATAFGAVVSWVRDHWPEMERIITPVMNQIQNVIDTAMGVIRETVAIVLDLITGDWSGAWDHLKELVSIVLDGVKETIDNSKAFLTEAVKGIGRAIADLGPDFASWGFGLGKAALDGMLEAVKGGAAKVKSFLNPFDSPPGWHALPQMYAKFGIRLGDAIGGGLQDSLRSAIAIPSMAGLPGMDIFQPSPALMSARPPAVSAGGDTIIEAHFHVPGGNVLLPEREIVEIVRRYNRDRQEQAIRSGASITYSMG